MSQRQNLQLSIIATADRVANVKIPNNADGLTIFVEDRNAVLTLVAREPDGTFHDFQVGANPVIFSV